MSAHVTTAIIADERNANSSQNGAILFDGIAHYGKKVNDMRCIDADKLLRDIEKYHVSDGKFQHWVQIQPTIEPEPKWIPCKDRLPERGNEVLVCYDFKGHRSVLTGVLYGDGSFHGYDDEYLTPEGRKYRKAVAWMPLPEPYQEEGDSE